MAILRRLFWQIYLAQLAIVLTALLVVGFFIFDAIDSFHRKQTISQLRDSARVAGFYLQDQTEALDSVAIDPICDKLGRRSDIRYTVVVPSGAVSGDSHRDPETMENHADRPEIISAFRGETGRSCRYSHTTDQHMMYLAAPVWDNGRISAVVRTSIALSDIDETMSHIQKAITYPFIAVLFFAGAVSLIVTRLITRPVKEIQNASQRLAKGDFDIRLREPYTKELADLADSVNKLAADLDKHTREVSRRKNEHDAMLSSMSEGVLATNLDEVVVYANGAALEMLGIEGEDIQGRNMRELVRSTAFYDIIDKVKTTRKPDAVDFTPPESPEKILRVKSADLKDSDKQIVGVLLVLSDVTEARYHDRVRRDFVSNVSHELKTPLTSINGFVETLLDGAIDEEDQARRFLNIIARQTGNLRVIIDDLLTLSRLEDPNSQRALNLVSCSVCKTLEAAQELVQRKSVEKEIEIDVECEPGLEFRMHQGLIEQAVVNLLDNAIAASSKGDKIKLRACEKGTNLRIEVEDHGCGIAGKYISQIFERFNRIDTGRSRERGGTGLGLSIVKHIAAIHNGTVYVESRVGSGSTFTIEMPMHDTSNEVT